MRRCLWLLAIAACDDGQAPSTDVSLDASATITCTTGPDAATALGVRGVELWDAFEGSYTLPANRPLKKGLQAATFTVSITRSQANVPGLDDCTRVAVPVSVSLQSADPALNETIDGVLRGSLYAADVVFATPECLLGQPSRIWGNVLFRQGEQVALRLRTDKDATWIAPPLQEVP